MSEKKDLEVKKNAAIGALLSFEEDAGKGVEGADKDSFTLPFLVIIQGLSKSMKTVDGAKPGLILNTVTNDLMKTVDFVQVAFERAFLIWERREKGGSYKGQIPASQAESMIQSGAIKHVEDKDGKQFWVDKDDMTYSDTRQHYILYQGAAGIWMPALISMSRTQVKHSKKLMSQITSLLLPSANGGGSFNPPSFARIYRGSPIEEKKNNNEWYSWSTTPIGMVEVADLYAKAKAMNKSVVGGKIKVDQEQSQKGETEGTYQGRVADQQGGAF